jgi:hypothetical protein
MLIVYCIGCVIFGGCIGFGVCSMMCAAKRADEFMRETELGRDPL